MSAPRLSVVIPAYNNGATIEETVESILGQHEVDFELIVADHASTDDTWDRLQRFGDDPRVTLLKTPGGGGAQRNWNRVSDAATGHYLKLVCGDDVLRPGALARQAEILDTGAVLTASRRDVVDARGDVLKRGWGLRGLTHRMPGPVAARRAARAGSNLFGEPASVMMRRDALVSTGGWFADFPYLIDQATYTRVLLQGEFVPDPEVGATFRMSATQWSVALTKAQASQAHDFHRWLHDQHPDVLSAADVRVGNLKASVMARARRASYAVLGRRMR